VAKVWRARTPALNARRGRLLGDRQREVRSFRFHALRFAPLQSTKDCLACIGTNVAKVVLCEQVRGPKLLGPKEVLKRPYSAHVFYQR
jgi:hypothetical protein